MNTVFYAIGAFIATIAIVYSLVSILYNVGSKLGFFSISIFLLGLTVGVLFLDSFFPEASNIPIAQFLLQFKSLIVLILVFCFLVLVILNLLSARAENSKPCDSAIDLATATYEPFVSEVGNSEVTILQRIRKGNSLLEKLQTSADDVDEMISESCRLLKETEQNFIDANTTPGQQGPEYNACISSKGNEEECKDLKLSPERLKAQDDRQRALAEKKYAREKEPFPGLLECFQNPDFEKEEKEEELRNILSELRIYLEKEAKLRKQCDQIQKTMAFVLHLTKKGNAAMESAKTQTEGFESQTGNAIQVLTGDVLLKEADSVIGKAETLVSFLSKTKSEFGKTKSEYVTLRGKVTRIADGQPSQTDLVQAPKPQQGSCPAYMFEYGTDAGVYCCADQPTEYSFDRGTYLKCPSGAGFTEELKKQRRKRMNEAMSTCGETDTACMVAIDSIFSRNLRKQPTCRHPDNPKTDQPVCTYICPKTGKECSYVEFKSAAS